MKNLMSSVLGLSFLLALVGFLLAWVVIERDRTDRLVAVGILVAVTAAISLPALLPFAPDFGVEVAMTIDALRAGLRVVEVEVDLHHNATGKDLSGLLHRARQARAIARELTRRRAWRPTPNGRTSGTTKSADAGSPQPPPP